MEFKTGVAAAAAVLACAAGTSAVGPVVGVARAAGAADAGTSASFAGPVGAVAIAASTVADAGAAGSGAGWSFAVLARFRSGSMVK